MKIAVLGNMNNNGFAIMRYLRDLGEDAHLLLYANDGAGTLAHFTPQNDTWDYAKWKPYIHRTSLVNSLYAGLKGPMNIFNFAYALVQFFRKTHEPRLHWTSSARIKAELDGYDFVIGSGIAPAFFSKAKLTLDGYYAYATGVEHLGAQELTARLPQMSLLKRAVTRQAMDCQRQGLRAVRCIFNAELSLTKQVLDREGIPFDSLPVPMVYPEMPTDPVQFSEALSSVLHAIDGRQYFMAVSRQLWKKPAYMDENDWWRETKNSDWLLRAFARLCIKRPNHGRLLVLASYGPDLEASKELCRTLDLEKHVIWMPKLARKELGVLARGAHAVAGEFKNPEKMIWGGVGWETLAAAKPLIHSFKFSPDQYETLYGTPCPPVLAVQNQDDILEYLLRLTDDPMFGEKVGEAAGAWFQEYQGRGLASKWLGALKAPMPEN